MNLKQDQMSIIIRESQWGGGFYGYRQEPNRLLLSANSFALLRLSVDFFQLPLTKKLKINFFCFKKLNIH